MKKIHLVPLVRLFIAGLFALNTAQAVPPPNGVAPVDPPPNGFAIDGDLMANTPAVNIGDWIANTNLAPGTGGSVLTLAGLPINTSRTFRLRDPYNGNDNVFKGGMKWRDNPNIWQWTTNKSSSKTDINNALLHLTSDTNGHIWAVVAADRYSTSGDSYIDFEFLQASLIASNNFTFASAGTNGGRTVGDLLFSLAFVGGGSIPDFLAFRWQTNGASGFDYADVTSLLSTGRFFMAVNTNTISVPYGAFGVTTYAANAFAEAAVDLTALLGSFDQCASFGFKTIMVKTKSSSSDTATIEDFITPFQYTLRIGPDAQAGPDQVRCTEGTETIFPLAGTAGSGLSTVSSTTWSVLNGSATIDNMNSLVTTARVSSASATLRLTVVQANGCTETDDIVLSVQQPPVCSIAGITNTCPRTTNTFTAPAGMTAYAWSVSGGGLISGPANQQTVKVVATAICGTNYTLSLNLVSNVCSTFCTQAVAVIDTGAPVLICPTNRVLDCPANTTTNNTGVATATDTCSRVTVTYSDEVTPGCGVSKVIARTWTATDECGNAVSCVQTITVRDITPPVITCPTNRVLQCPADTSSAANGMATAVDACGAATVTFNDVVTTNCGNTFVIARTWTATDLCNNSSSCLQTITVRDTTAPVITCPPSVTLQCPADTSTNANGMAMATDACSSFTITYADTTTNGCGSTMTIARRWTATDSCGNSSSCTQTIRVQDTNAPVIICPPDRTLDCPADTSTNNTGVATATDACGSANITFTDAITNGCSGTRTIVRTWRAVDACGNQSSCVQTIIVRDITPPVITCPPDRLLECPANTTTNATGRATATDSCSSVVIAFTDTVTNQCPGAMTIARRWTATDQCGNQSACIQTIIVRDTTLPVLTCPPNRVLNCPANTSTNATGVATATDSCSPARVTYSDSITNGCGVSQTIARTWTATDQCGNAVSCTQMITVRDTNAPAITCPPNITRECGQDASPAATGTATATDACGGATISFSDAITPLCPGSQIIVRTWTATDACGNQASCQQTITVRDTTPPTFVANVICSFSADELAVGAGAGLLASNYATLFPQGVTLGIYAPSNSTTAPNGLQWLANNPGLTALKTAMLVTGSSAAISQDVQNPTTTFGAGELGRQALALTVNIALNKSGLVGAGPNNFGDLIYIQAGDSLSGKSVQAILAAANQSLAGMTLPSGHTFVSLTTLLNNLNLAFQNCAVSTFGKARLSAPVLVVSCSAQIPYPNFNLIVASDSCSSVTISGLPDVITNQTCANRLTLLRSWRATDACSNSTTATMTIIINDTNPPAIACPPDITLEYPANLNPTNTGTATATDNCGVAGINFTDTSTNVCGVGRIVTRTWGVWDACLNVANCVQTITVRDTTAPVITCPPNVTVECGGSTTPSATGYATATDLSGAYTITNSDSITPGCGGSYTISRRWTAFDACGNAASCTQTITVRDTTPPTITFCPANITLECPANISTNNTGLARASDLCSAVVVTFSDSSATVCGNARIISRTWRATDACGNSSTCVQTLTIRDTVPPVLTVPTNTTVECGSSVAPSATGQATATDACNAVNVSFSDTVSNSCGNARTILRRWVAMDSCNNSNVAVQTITVRDTTPPVLTLPSSRTLNCPANTTTNNTGMATATDCSAVAISYSDVVSNGCGITKTIWRTWTAVDQCGNSANGLQTIVVQDTPPTISCPTINVQCVGDVPQPYTNIAAFRAAGGVANDACDADLSFVLVSNSVMVGSCPGRITRVYRVTDDCGLTAQCAQTVIVDDTIAPTLTCAPNVTIECGSSLDPAILGNVSATDNCSTNVVITRSDSVVNSTYDLNWYASDSDSGTGPYSPTFLQLGPGSLPCPSGGRAIDPLRNAVCYAPNGQLDALTSMGSTPLAAGQIVPFQLVIDAGGGPGTEKGMIEVTANWSTYTTSNDRFGYDTNYMVYCAFVDAGDPGSIDPHYNAKVDSFTSRLINSGTSSEQIEGTFRISGLDSGDRVIVEVWMVLQSTVADHVGGTIASGLVSARKFTTPPQEISLSTKTIPIGNLNKFEPLPPPQPQPPAPPIPPQPPVPPGRTTSVIDRTWAATDDCGNRSTCVQRITVRDTTPPSLTAPNLVLECPADTSTNSTGMAIAVDGCGTPSVSYSDVVSNTCGFTKTILRTWKATDGNLNTNTIVQTIIVADTTPPAMTAVTNKTIVVGAALVFDPPTATDPCGLATVSSISTTTNTLIGGAYSVTRAWQATDVCGNQSATQAQIITVNPLVQPSLQRLTISPNGATGLLLRWPTNAADYRLECAAATDAKRWYPVPLPIILTNGECRVYVPKAGACQFFRLANTPPYLEGLKLSGGNLRLTWPTAPAGFQLEGSDTMTNGSWSAVAITPGVSNSLNHVTVSAATAKKFYRLKK